VCRGCKRTPNSFDLLTIWAKALKIRVKMAPKICIKTHEDLCLKVTPKTGLHDLCGRKFAGKSCTKNFPGKFGEIQQNPSHSKNLPAPTPTI